jgi:hypothetical protein
MDSKYVKMKTINKPNAILKMKLVKMMQTMPTPFGDRVQGNSWWCWFKEKNI